MMLRAGMAVCLRAPVNSTLGPTAGDRMAYDEHLTGRIRKLLGKAPGITEKRMFGGLAFLLSGNMAVVASGQGGLMVRVDPAERDALLARTNAEPMLMRGSPTSGWLRVASEHVSRRAQLQTWVDRGAAAARARPPK